MTVLRTIALGAMLASLAGGASADVFHIDFVGAYGHLETFRTSLGDVAQPMTWLMMILGAGMIGASRRGRRATAVA